MRCGGVSGLARVLVSWSEFWHLLLACYLYSTDNNTSKEKTLISMGKNFNFYGFVVNKSAVSFLSQILISPSLPLLLERENWFVVPTSMSDWGQSLLKLYIYNKKMKSIRFRPFCFDWRLYNFSNRINTEEIRKHDIHMQNLLLIMYDMIGRKESFAFFFPMNLLLFGSPFLLSLIMYKAPKTALECHFCTTTLGLEVFS